MRRCFEVPKMIPTILALCLVIATTTAGPNVSPLQEVTKSVGSFSNDLYRQIARSVPNNLVCSALSSDIVLAMLAYGAAGNTRKQLQKALYLPNNEVFGRVGYQRLTETLVSIPDVDLRIVNTIFMSNTFVLSPAFADMTENQFHSESQYANFQNAVGAANTINNWVEKKTNRLIKNFISPSAIDANTNMILLNAIYFKAQWKYRFNAKRTGNRKFYLNRDQHIDVPTMVISADFKFGQIPHLEASFIEIPYKSKGLSMVVILPDDYNGLPKIEEKLMLDLLEQNLQETTLDEMTLELPKFKILSELDLGTDLRKLGLGEIFGPKADFSRISRVPVKVDKFVQKAFIEVNEEGSEAAVISGVQVIPLSASFLPPRMRINRPFQYIIKKNNLVLFRGHVTNPTLYK